MAASVLLVQRVARHFGLAVDSRALALCAVMALIVNFSAILLSVYLTFNHLMMLVVMVIGSAALVTGVNEFLLRRDYSRVLLETGKAPEDGESEEGEVFPEEASEDTGQPPVPEAEEPPIVWEVELPPGAVPPEGELAETPAAPPIPEPAPMPPSPPVETPIFKPEPVVEEPTEEPEPEPVVEEPTEEPEPEPVVEEPTEEPEPEPVVEVPTEEPEPEPVVEEPTEAPEPEPVVEEPTEEPEPEPVVEEPTEEPEPEPVVEEPTEAPEPEPVVEEPTEEPEPEPVVEEPTEEPEPEPVVEEPTEEPEPERVVEEPTEEPEPEPLTLDDYLDRAYAEKDANHLDAAAALYREAIDKFSDDSYVPFLVIELGNLYKDEGKYADAIETYRRALSIPIIQGQNGIADEFRKNITYLDTVSHITARHGAPRISYNKIPPDWLAEIEKAFAKQTD